ncbi:MAG: hypothetical protein LUG18_15605 [Candidatus Azobacteroides sp.]|nr:hypothetical protein [Candidatus Azobacteroides sp.]
MILLPYSSSLSASIRLPEIFSDAMIFQQQTEVPLWEKAPGRKIVKIKTFWNGKNYEILMDEKGKRRGKMNTPVAGRPYKVSMAAGKEIKLENAFTGETWCYSEQSIPEVSEK